MAAVVAFLDDRAPHRVEIDDLVAISGMDGLPPVADRKAVLCLGTAGEGLCCRSRGGNVTSGVRDARQPAHHVVAVAGGVVVIVGDCPDPSVVIPGAQTANLT